MLFVVWLEVQHCQCHWKQEDWREMKQEGWRESLKFSSRESCLVAEHRTVCRPGLGELRSVSTV